ncbi:hypothetical protein [Actinomadura rifamycini]|uniref:hypothetical protein n=1 Tax=Actinomadura rifamycini TaxID=31962 RepID=UPI00041F1C18|nr:hypothetical protein [Actinomadura rifamycini]
MEHPPQAAPDAPPRRHDRSAVAIANASLFNVGYLMLGRRRLAAATGLVTLVLVALLATAFRSAWFEAVVLLWWAALIGHGWILAGRAPSSSRGGRRVPALCVTLPVLAAVGLLRFDAAGIEDTVAQARRDGDCAEARDALDAVWFGHRLAAAPATARGDRTADACRRLAAAADELETGLTGDIAGLRDGHAALAAVLADAPGHERMVGATLERFLAGLPAADPCATAGITDWLRSRKASGDVLDRSEGAVARTAPTALVRCGDRLMSGRSWQTARSRYEQLLALYPGDALAAEARAGARKATRAIELAAVRELLKADDGEEPRYCAAPAKYTGADARGGGVNRALFVGDDEHASALPKKWRTTDPADAVLVVCLGEQRFGPVQQSCPYTYGGGKIVTVRFHKIEIPVKVYELRTGEAVADTEVRIGGGSCPAVIPYTSFGTDTGPPTKDYVDPSRGDVRAAFEALVTGD